MNVGVIAAHLAVQQSQRNAEIIRRRRERDRQKREAQRRKENKV